MKQVKAFSLPFLFLITTFFLSLELKGQWTFRKAQNTFDGEVFMAIGTGSSNDELYSSPRLIVRYKLKTEELEIYINDAGPSICDDKKVLISIDQGEMFSFESRGSVDGESWFISSYSMEMLDFMEMLSTGRQVEFRLRSSCSLTDISFSLSGANAALSQIISTFRPVAEAREAEYWRKQNAREDENRNKAFLDSIRSIGREQIDSVYAVLISEKEQIGNIYYNPKWTRMILAGPENSYLNEIWELKPNEYFVQVEPHGESGIKNHTYKVIAVCKSDSCIAISGFINIKPNSSGLVIDSNKVKVLDQTPRYTYFNVRLNNTEWDHEPLIVKVKHYDGKLLEICDERLEAEKKKHRKKQSITVIPYKEVSILF